MLVSASDVWSLSGRWHAFSRWWLFLVGEGGNVRPLAPPALLQTAQLRGDSDRHSHTSRQSLRSHRLWGVAPLDFSDYLEAQELRHGLQLHLMALMVPPPPHMGLTAPQHILLSFPGKNEHQRTSQKRQLPAECRAPAINGNIKRSAGT